MRSSKNSIQSKIYSGLNMRFRQSYNHFSLIMRLHQEYLKILKISKIFVECSNEEIDLTNDFH